MKWVRWIIDNICMIFVVFGALVGILCFFINWETIMHVTTSGLDFAFGRAHGFWSDHIGNHCYIPLIITVCSMISAIVMVYEMFHKDKRSKAMVIVFVCGIIMLALMTIWAGTGINYMGDKIYFADYVGTGMRMAWNASNAITIGSGLYVASEVTREDK